MNFQRHPGDVYSAHGPGVFFQWLSVTVTKLARGEWIVACFNRDGDHVQSFTRTTKPEAFAAAEKWLTETEEI